MDSEQAISLFEGLPYRSDIIFPSTKKDEDAVNFAIAAIKDRDALREWARQILDYIDKTSPGVTLPALPEKYLTK